MGDEDLVVLGPRKDRTLPTSLGHHYAAVLAKHGCLVAQVQEVDERVVSRTYSELLLQGQRVARFLRDRGLGPGDTIMVCCGNTLSFTPIMLGTQFIGAALSPINYQYAAVEMLHHLTVIEPNLVICNPESLVAMREAVEQSGVAIPLVAMETVRRAIEDQRKDKKEFHLGEVRDPSTHLAFVLCSSGTSGKVKAIELTHESILLMEDFQIYRFSPEPLGHREVALSAIGPYMVTMHMAQFIVFTRGIKQVLLERFTEKDFLHTIQKFKVNYTMLGAPQVTAIARWPDVELYDTTTLRSVGCGGSPSILSMVELAQKRLNTKMAQIYGMTECLGPAVPAYDVTDRPGTSGKLNTNVDAKVLDIETGQPLGRNCQGELCFRNPSAMKGYRNNPEATAAMIDEDGFLHTGDLGYFDQDDFLFVRDRVKELIKYKEIQVNVVDIEGVLLSHPGVQEVAVIGVFHEVDLEHAVGFVVRRPGSEVTEGELQELVEGHLHSNDWLHGGVRFIDSIPMTGSGKVKKRILRDLAT